MIREYYQNPMGEYLTTLVLVQALACQAQSDQTKLKKRFYMPCFYANENRCCGFFFGTHRDQKFEYGKMMKNMAPTLLNSGIRMLAGSVLQMGNVSDGAAYDVFRNSNKVIKGKKQGSHFYQGIANSYRQAEGLTYWMIINEIDKDKGPLASSNVLTALTRSRSEFDLNMCGMFKISHEGGTYRFHLHFFSTSYDQYVKQVSQVTERFDPHNIDGWTSAWSNSMRPGLVLELNSNELPDEPTGPSEFDDLTVVMDNPLLN